MKKIAECIDMLVDYAKAQLGLTAKNADYARNTVLDILGISFPPTGAQASGTIDALLDAFSSAVAECGDALPHDAEYYRDAVMGALSLSPQALQDAFYATEKESGSKAATDGFYDYCVKNNYVKKAQLDKNPRFESDGLIITINKSKPEFRDAKKAAAGNAVSGGYPLCSICHENEGYANRNKRTLRTVDIELDGDRWFWQFSPYGYFYQHGIAVNYEHTPMGVDKSTFARLLDFVDRFPHYFIGSNAALTRIGGSVLAHDHYQGGGESLPLHKAAAAYTFTDGKSGATLEVLDWAGTVVRAVSHDRAAIIDASERIRAAWVDFDDPMLGIVHADEDGVHNAISPTAVKTERGYEMNIILRSNITSAQYPDGVFHAHPEFHVIKKESIGLIEAQGLFILPGRLEKELGEIAECICNGAQLPRSLADYSDIYGEIVALCGGRRDRASVDDAIKAELGSVCKRILYNTAVFKDKAETVKFLKDKVIK